MSNEVSAVSSFLNWDKYFPQGHCNNPADIYLLKINNGNTRTTCEICSKLAIKTLERSY